MRVELRDEARDDLANGAWFYGRQSPGLDDYFLISLHDDLRSLQAVCGVVERYKARTNKAVNRSGRQHVPVASKSMPAAWLPLPFCHKDDDTTETNRGRETHRFRQMEVEAYRLVSINDTWHGIARIKAGHMKD